MGQYCKRELCVLGMRHSMDGNLRGSNHYGSHITCIKHDSPLAATCLSTVLSRQPVSVSECQSLSLSLSLTLNVSLSLSPVRLIHPQCMRWSPSLEMKEGQVQTPMCLSLSLETMASHPRCTWPASEFFRRFHMVLTVPCISFSVLYTLSEADRFEV